MGELCDERRCDEVSRHRSAGQRLEGRYRARQAGTPTGLLLDVIMPLLLLISAVRWREDNALQGSL